VLTFKWDPLKAARNLRKFEEAATVFGDSRGRIENDSRHSVDEQRYVLLGCSGAARLLAVMFADRGEAIRFTRARQATGDTP